MVARVRDEALAAAKTILAGRSVATLGLIGCGVINFEIVRFLHASLASLKSIVLFDVDHGRARQFLKRCRKSFGLEVSAVADIDRVLHACELISIATTSIRPHIFDLSMCSPSAVLLHVSLRDISPETILQCDNIVDDVEHVCRAQTSIHLAERLTGSRGFITCTPGEVLVGERPLRRDSGKITVFSPFGLGILDI